MTSFPAPHGGALRDLYIDPEERAAINEQSKHLPSWTLTPRQCCDVELLLDGSFSPLDGFLDREQYAAVIARMRLPDGTFWPLPITLDVTDAFARAVGIGERVGLRDAEGVLIAIMTVSDIFRPERRLEAQEIYGSTSIVHPGADLLLNRTHPACLAGSLVGVNAPTHYAFNHLRTTPHRLRSVLSARPEHGLAAFHTNALVHRMHLAALVDGLRRHPASLLLHPAIGAGRVDDADQFARIRCYERSLDHFPDTTRLHVIESAPRWAGIREAMLHAIVRQNFGCGQLFVDGQQFVPPSEAGDFDARFEAAWKDVSDELAIDCVTLSRYAYVPAQNRFLPATAAAEDGVLPLPDAEAKRHLSEGHDLPSWFTFPEVVEELRHTNPPRHRQGFTVFFTGLSGAGKSTVANALLVRLMAIGGRQVTLLDGDMVRTRLSSELGFSREHRDLNILRIGYVASEITKNGGVAICAPIAPYASTRRQVRDMVEAVGGFIEIHVATPLSVCERRDRKGLYAKAHAGLLKGMTGVDDPYEAPEDPALRLDTSELIPTQSVDRIIELLTERGYLASLTAAVTPLHPRLPDRLPATRLARPEKRA